MGGGGGALVHENIPVLSNIITCHFLRLKVHAYFSQTWNPLVHLGTGTYPAQVLAVENDHELSRLYLISSRFSMGYYRN